MQRSPLTFSHLFVTQAPPSLLTRPFKPQSSISDSSHPLSLSLSLCLQAHLVEFVRERIVFIFIFHHHLMAAIWSLIAVFMVFITIHSSVAFPYQLKLQTSTISASPAYLPNPPLSSPSPSLSPDITPLFPSPVGVPLSPAESSLPTIPSSPSPPNPDAVATPVPGSASSPAGHPDSSAFSLSSSTPLASVFFLCFLAFWLMQLSGM